jgi:hypothetical protein
MLYFSTKLATDFTAPGWKDKFFRTALWFVPLGNPDFESSFHLVRTWLVEVDEAGNANREIGLDSSQEPVIAAPWGKNMGFWTDINGPFPLDSADSITSDEFEAKWALFSTTKDIPGDA